MLAGIPEKPNDQNTTKWLECNAAGPMFLGFWGQIVSWTLFNCTSCVMTAGGRLNKKDGLTRYGDSHVKDKTVSPTVLSLTWKSPYVDKTVFILRRGPGVIILAGSLGQIQPLWWRQRWINSNTLATVPVKSVFGFPNLLSQWKHEFHLSIPVPLTSWTWCN